MALTEDVQDWWSGQNYLGRPSSIRLTGESQGDQGGAASGVLDAGNPPGGGVPAPTGTSGAAPRSTVMPGAASGAGLSPVLRAFLAAKGIGDKAWSITQPLLGPGAPGEFGAYATPSGQFSSSVPEVLRDLQFPGGDLAPGSFVDALGGPAAEAGAEAATEVGAELAGSVSSAWAGPIFSAMKAGIDFIGEGKIPGQDIINLIAPHTFGPSAAWQSFPGRLGQTLSTEYDASNTLATALVGAQGPQAIQQAIAAWRQAVGGAIPGFASDVTDPYMISPLPGAGGHSKGASGQGTAHEGYLADFGPLTTGLQALVQAAQQGRSPADRISAFQSAAQPLLDAAAARKAEQQRMLEQFLASDNPWTGSA